MSLLSSILATNGLVSYRIPSPSLPVVPASNADYYRLHLPLLAFFYNRFLLSFHLRLQHNARHSHRLQVALTPIIPAPPPLSPNPTREAPTICSKCSLLSPIKAMLVNRVSDFGLAHEILACATLFQIVDFSTNFACASTPRNCWIFLQYEIDAISLICILLFYILSPIPATNSLVSGSVPSPTSMPTISFDPVPFPVTISGCHLLSSWKSTTGLATGDLDSDSDDDEAVPKVMHGWLTLYTSEDPNSPFTKQSTRTQLMTFIKQLEDKYKEEELSITFTGHNLGASMSILVAFDLAENGISDIPILAIVFGSLQVGNKAFNERLKQFSNVNILHVRNKIDLIPLYPSLLLGFVNTGTDLFIDTRNSPSLKKSRNPSDWHNLQAMLHVVARWNGEEGEFELKVEKSLALVNKSSEKEECMVPGSWWVKKNKGMVLDGKGNWVLAPSAEE